MDYEILEFETIEETWNEYELSDGNRIKGRLILTRIFQIFDKIKSEFPIYEAERKKFFVVYTSANMRKTPNMPSSQEELNKIKKIPVKVLSNNEKWNVYRIIKNGEIIKAKLIVDEIFVLENTYDNKGNPFYQVNSGEMIVPAKNTKTYAQ